MQPYSDYEIAQRRIAERQASKSRFRILLVVIAILVFITLVSGESAFCTVPIGIITALFAFADGIEMYYATPEHGPSEAEVEQEMSWLFGKDGQNQSTTQAHALAQERIRKRRIKKWKFFGHLLLFVPVNGWLIHSAISTNNGDRFGFLLVTLTWFILFIAHAESVFPSQRILEKREASFGNQILSELDNLQNVKVKPKEKLKRGKYYEVGDDGELVEVEDEIVSLEEKPKREIDNR
jgi:2TM domain